MIKQTHTFANLAVSRQTFDEIAGLLRAAGYDHAFIEDVIDMNGIGLALRQCVSTVADCEALQDVAECGATICKAHGHIERCSDSNCPYLYVGLRLAIDDHKLDCQCEQCSRFVNIASSQWSPEQVLFVMRMLEPCIHNFDELSDTVKARIRQKSFEEFTRNRKE